MAPSGINNKFINLGFEVADNTTALLSYWDNNLICRYANNSYIEWFGRHPEEIINKMHIKDLLGALLFEKNLVYINAALKGKEQVFERQILLPSGQLKNTIATYTPDWQNGMVSGFFSHVADISTINAKHPLPGDILTKTSSDKKIIFNENPLDKVVESLQASLLKGFPGIAKLSKLHYISESKLKRDFKAKYNSSLFAYYRTLQMELAEKYLTKNMLSKKQVAALLNFANPANFSTCYNKYLKDHSTKRRISEIETENDEKYKTFVTQTPFAIAMYDTSMKCLAVSQKWIDNYNLQNQRVIGKSHYEIFPSLEPKWKKIYEECLKGEIKRCDEEYLIAADGSERWYKWDIRPWYNKGNQIGGLLISTEDITSIKLKQNESNKTLKILEKTNEIARIGTWEINLASNTTTWNNITKEILDMPESYDASLFLEGFVKENISKELLKKSINYAIEYALYFDIHLSIVTTKGQEKRIRLVGYPEFSNKRCEKLFGILQDVTSASQ